MRASLSLIGALTSLGICVVCLCACARVGVMCVYDVGWGQAAVGHPALSMSSLRRSVRKLAWLSKGNTQPLRRGRSELSVGVRGGVTKGGRA